MSDQLENQSKQEEPWEKDCTRCGDFIDFELGKPSIDYYHGFGDDGGFLCEKCGEEFESWLQSENIGFIDINEGEGMGAALMGEANGEMFGVTGSKEEGRYVLVRQNTEKEDTKQQAQLGDSA